MNIIKLLFEMAILFSIGILESIIKIFKPKIYIEWFMDKFD